MGNRLAVALPGEAWVSVKRHDGDWGWCHRCERKVGARSAEPVYRIVLHDQDGTYETALCADCHEKVAIEDVLRLMELAQDRRAKHNEEASTKYRAAAREHRSRAERIRALAYCFAADGGR